MDDIVKLFDRRYSDDNKYFTHVTMLEPRGKWNLARDNIENFWNNYSKDVDDHYFAVAECPQKYSMLVSDIDYTCKYKTKMKHLYGDKDIFTVVRAYIESIGKNVALKSDKCFEVVVLIKDPYIKVREDKRLRSAKTKTVKREEISHGFHLAFPNLFLDLNTRKKIREDAQQILVESCSKVVLDNIDNKPWLLYGSCKSEKSGRYEAAFVLNKKIEKIYVEDWLETYKCFDVNEDPFIPEMDDLPRVLSVFPLGRKCLGQKEELGSIGYNILVCERKDKDEDVEQEYDDVKFEENFELCKKLINKISDFRADERDSWRAIGGALHTSLFGTEEGLQLFLDFSEKSHKFDREACEREWKGFKGYYKIGTLIYYFKQDNSAPKSRYRRKH